MDMQTVTTSLGNTHLNDTPEEPEYLLFNPHPSAAKLQQAMDNIPRFLFRIATPRSDGETNATWVRSDAAYRHRPSSATDIFYDLNVPKKRTVAATLNNHLRWWEQRGRHDNFVSWTSSLLFALRYIYYRYSSSKDGSNLQDIKLCVVDTTLFERGTFMRDLDLIYAFRDFDIDHHPGQDLRNLRELREACCDGRYYFGEYLSQGSLKVESKCQVISAQALFDGNRLPRLQSQFGNIHQEPRNVNRPKWANEVIDLRKKIWWDPQPMETLEVQNAIRAASEITDNFSPGWRFPMAVYFAALINPGQCPDDEGRTGVDDELFAYFRSGHFSEEQRRIFTQSPSNIVDPTSMPELIRVRAIRREIYQHSRLRNALDSVAEAEVLIDNLHRSTRVLNHRGRLLHSYPNPALDRARQDLLSRLARMRWLCNGVVEHISS